MGESGVEAYSEVKRPGWAAQVRRHLPSVRLAAKALIRRLPMAIAFFLLSLAQCFYVPSPYAICCLAALLRCGVTPVGAGLGLAAGLAFRLIWGLPKDIWQFAACLICLPLMRIPWKKNGYVTALAGFLLLFRALPGMMGAADARGVILNAASVLLGIASMPALLRAGRLWKAGFRELNEDDLLCLMLPILLVIAGAGRVSAFQANIGYMAAGAFTLIFAWTKGTGTGVLCALGSGLSLLLSGQSALMLVNLVFGGLMAGLTQGKNRLMTGAVYLLATVTVTYLIALSFQKHIFFADAATVLLFVGLPNRWMRRVTGFIRKTTWQRPKENAYTRLKMQRWVKAIDKLTDALPTPRISETTEEEISETFTEMLCPDCERLLICWHDQYEQTKAGMTALSRAGEEENDELDIINRYFSACPRISRLPEIVRRIDEEKQRRMQRSVCAAYEREMLQTHLTALSQAAQRISLDGFVSPEEAYWISQVEEALAARRFPGKAAFVKKVDGRMTVCLQWDSLALRPDADDGLCREISLRLHSDLTVTDRRGGRIILEEEPPLAVITGMATACAVTADRKKPQDNGDAVLIRTLDGGRELIALSDGMGHGAGAQDESMKTLEMLSLCMEAGYSRQQAMTAVNGSMLSATGGEKFATVDLCLVDLWTGEAAMNKLGACPSYLVRGQKIDFVRGEALPLGIVERVMPMEHAFSLGEGDMLLMMTDGISDAFAEDEDIAALIRRDRSPQQIADSLLREALIRYGGLPQDDMTVICAKVTERKRKTA